MATSWSRVSVHLPITFNDLVVYENAHEQRPYVLLVWKYAMVNQMCLYWIPNQFSINLQHTDIRLTGR